MIAATIFITISILLFLIVLYSSGPATDAWTIGVKILMIAMCVFGLFVIFNLFWPSPIFVNPHSPVKLT